LAKELGIWDVDGMLEEMPWATFCEWTEYFQLDPFGGERGDVQAAIVASTIANVNRGKNSRALKVKDFMPAFGKNAPKRGGARKPLTDPSEWQRAKRMAAVLA
jgi:hypothetical protein